MQKIVNIHEAKTHLSRILSEVEGGVEVIIARSGKPIARLVPTVKKYKPRKPGLAKGKIYISNDFDDPLPPNFLKTF